MSAATLFDGGKLAGPNAPAPKRGGLVSFLAGGFGAAQEVPQARQVPPPHAGQLAMRDYVRGLERMIQRTEHAQIAETLVEVTPKEIQTLVEKSAKAKARYLAAALELAEGDGLPEGKQIETLEQARQRHEAMQQGLGALMDELRRGNVRVDGVAPDLAANASEAPGGEG